MLTLDSFLNGTDPTLGNICHGVGAGGRSLSFVRRVACTTNPGSAALQRRQTGREVLSQVDIARTLERVASIQISIDRSGICDFSVYQYRDPQNSTS
jgi:hypothetical protein